MAKAAISSYSAALHSLAIIQFNDSEGTKKDKDLKAGVALCARSTFHVDALGELGHCLQDSYGVTKNIAEGRRFLVHKYSIFPNLNDYWEVFVKSLYDNLLWCIGHFSYFNIEKKLFMNCNVYLNLLTTFPELHYRVYGLIRCWASAVR